MTSDMNILGTLRRMGRMTAGGVLLVVAGCDVIETQRQPLTVIEQGPGGTSGGAAPVEVGPLPDGVTCWDGQLPAEPRAPAPKLTFDEACRRGATASDWTFKTSAGRTTTSGASADRRGDLVGRWFFCSAASARMLPSANLPPSAGLEFAGNGRWQLLSRDPTGAIVGSVAQRGYYYVLGSGQLDLVGEDPTVGLRRSGFVAFADGDPDVVRLQNDGLEGVYARVEASPGNGDENAPSTSDGRCSMVGTWDVPANPVEPASTWSFDGAGNFVAGPRGANLCDGHTMYGTYRVTAGLFQLTTNWNLGLCDWWFDAAYPATFDADCSHVTLVQRYDNCTGGRGYLNDTTVLTRTP